MRPKTFKTHTLFPSKLPPYLKLEFGAVVGVNHIGRGSDCLLVGVPGARRLCPNGQVFGGRPRREQVGAGAAAVHHRY